MNVRDSKWLDFREEEGHYGVVDKVGIKYDLKRPLKKKCGLARRMEKDRHSRLKKQHDNMHKQEINVIYWRCYEKLCPRSFTHLLDLILILILRCVVIFYISQMRKVRLMELKLVAFQFTLMELIDFSPAIGEVWL